MRKVLILESHHKTKLFIEGVLRAYNGLVDITVLSVLPSVGTEIKKRYPFISVISLLPLAEELNGAKHQNYTDAYHFFVREYNVSASNIFQSDRRLRYFKKDIRENYIGYLFLKFSEILRKNEFDFALLEATWSHEQVFCILAKKTNLKILIPVNDKIASGKFNIFNCPLRLQPYNANLSDAVETGTAHISSSKSFSLLKKRNEISLSKFQRMLDTIHVTVFNKRNRFIHEPFLQVLFVQLFRIVRYYSIRYFKLIKFIGEEDIKKITSKYSNVVIIYLHVQPEAGIDVIASKFRDQLKSVIDLRMATANDVAIIVKDHPHDVGRKSLTFFKRLNDLNDVFLVSPWLSSSELIDNFSLIHVSFAGTITIEAAMSGKRSVCLGETFFTRAGLVPDGKAIRDGNIVDCSPEPRLTPDEVKLLLSKIQFDGNVGAPNLDKSILSDANLDMFASAIKKVTAEKG